MKMPWLEQNNVANSAVKCYKTINKEALIAKRSKSMIKLKKKLNK